MAAKKRKVVKKAPSRSVTKRRSKSPSLVIQFAVVFIFVAAIVLVAYVVKMFL